MKNAGLNTILLSIIIVVLLTKQFQQPGPIQQRPGTVLRRRAVPMFNYNTQRVAPFTQIGILYKNDSNTILPLYGRRTHVRSNTWNYYTSTNDDNRIKLELNIKDRDCLDKVGCKELYTGDSLFIPEYSSVFTVKIYN